MNTRVFVILICMISLAACSDISDYKINDEMKRSEFVELSFIEQQNMLINLKPEIRVRLWKDKLSDTMASDNLNKDEKSMINSLYQELNEDVYIDGTESHSRYIAQSERIIEVLVHEYGWSEEKLFLYLMTIMTEKELMTAGYTIG